MSKLGLGLSIFSLGFALTGCAPEAAGAGDSEEVVADQPNALSGSWVTTYSNYSFPSGAFYNEDIQLRINTDPGPGAKRFFAHNFGMQGSGGYIGLQTDGRRPNGTVGKIAIFSIWDASGATAGSSGSVCGTFGGEGTGWSCRLTYEWQAGHTYRLRVWALSAHSWGAWVMDTGTGAEVQIGTINTPTSIGWLSGGSSTFTEWYGGDFNQCSDLHLSRVTWYNPTAQNGSVTSTFGYNSIGNGSCAAYRSSTGTGPTVHSMGL